jgi:hypothetical protein
MAKRRLSDFFRAWADVTPMSNRQLAVWTMTPAFAIFAIVCAVVHAWGGEAISGAAVVFGIWRWWRLPKRWGG